jgi:type IV secretion system protein VirD4
LCGPICTENTGRGFEMIFNPAEVGWHLGRSHEPRGGQLWVPWDRTAGVIGPQGSGKTLDLLIPALLSASGLRW